MEQTTTQPVKTSSILHICTATFITYNCTGKAVTDITYNVVNIQSVTDSANVDAYLANVKRLEQAPNVSYPLLIDQHTTVSYERLKLLEFLWSVGWIVDAGYKTSKLSVFNKNFTSMMSYYLDAYQTLVLVPWFGLQNDKPWFSTMGYKLMDKDKNVALSPIANELVVSNHLFFETKQVPESKAVNTKDVPQIVTPREPDSEATVTKPAPENSDPTSDESN